MTRRECSFLLIGLGAGLELAVVAAISMVVWMTRHMFIMGIRWVPGAIILLAPFVLILIGFVVLLLKRERRESN